VIPLGSLWQGFSELSLTWRGLGQRIVARLRERTYGAALRQEVEFVERGEGDVLSRLSVDTSIVGERSLCLSPPMHIDSHLLPVLPKTFLTVCVPL
jgi:hypothetical protein